MAKANTLQNRRFVLDYMINIKLDIAILVIIDINQINVRISYHAKLKNIL